jgi:RNA polymerase sigma-70 factor (ECF subfamily)
MTAWNRNAPQAGLRDNALTGEETQLLLDEIWRTQSRRLLSITWRITRNPEDAEDALQDAFLRAFTHIGDFDGRSALSTWLTRIAINSSLMVLRKRRTRAAISLEDTGDGTGIPPVARLRDPRSGPEELAVQRDGSRRLREHVYRLPAPLCRPLQLHALDEHSVEETAKLCGISVSATKSRLYRARASLHSSLEPSLKPAGRELRQQPLAS